MKKFDLEEIAKNMWEKYLEKNDPPKEIPKDPIKHYGKNWKGWIHFLVRNSATIQQDLIDKKRQKTSNSLSSRDLS